MKIYYYPDFSSDPNGGGPVRREIVTLQKERPPKLWALVYATLTRIGQASSLDSFIREGIVTKLLYIREPIYEIKIPPKKRSEGVFRIYFAYEKDDRSRINFLSAEKKQGKSSADKVKVHQAVTRYKEHIG